jgi:general secretion pathway protein I
MSSIECWGRTGPLSSEPRRCRARATAGRCRRVDGFSLLEMVVAIAILGLALAALYQAASGATRNVRSDEKYAFGVELARSLLVAHTRVPAEGISRQGETEGGFAWRIDSRPLDFERTALAGAGLQQIEVRVSWQDGSRRREMRLDSVVEGVAQ